MLGPEGVGASVANLLLAQIVGEVDALSASNGALADGTGAGPNPGDPADPVAIAQLVVPQLVTSAPPDDVTAIDVAEWPFLAVSIRATSRMRELDVDPWHGSGAPAVAGTVYEVDYSGRVYTWVRGDGYAQTKAVRDRLMLAVRQVLLRHQADNSVRIVPTSLTEDFAPVGVDSTLQASIGAGWTAATWRVQEFLDVATFGQPASVTVSVGRMPDTP